MKHPHKALIGLLLACALLTVLAGCSSSGSSLDGTRWRLTGWTLSSLDPADLTITAQFSAGKISGNGGVNSYSGPYTTGSGAAFLAGPFASTQMAGPEPAMRGESAYFTLLGLARSYKVVDSTLTLYDKGGNESLIFTASTK